MTLQLSATWAVGPAAEMREHCVTCRLTVGPYENNADVDIFIHLEHSAPLLEFRHGGLRGLMLL